MKTKISFFILLPVLFLIFNLNSHVFAQDSTGTLDSKLTGTWITTEKDAMFSKIQFGDDGSFLGFTESADKNPFATGTYSVKGNALNITADIKSTNPNVTDPVSVTYIFTNYSTSKEIHQK